MCREVEDPLKGVDVGAGFDGSFGECRHAADFVFGSLLDGVFEGHCCGVGWLVDVARRMW